MDAVSSKAIVSLPVWRQSDLNPRFDLQSVWMSALAFHEKAGRCQAILGLVSSYPKFSFARIAGNLLAFCGGGQGRAQRVYLEP
jgi:hypothetical protein